MTPSEVALAAIAALSLIATVVFSVINSRQAARSATAAEKSAASARGSLDLAQEQLRSSAQAHIDSLQPYIWADLRPREDGGGLMDLVVGNSGPTVATDVRVEFEPSLDQVTPSRWQEDTQAVQAQLKDGLKSIPPGRVYTWSLGVVFEFFGPEQPPAREFQLTINGNGPHGPMPTSTFSIRLDDLERAALTATGLGTLQKPLKQLGDQLKEISRSITMLQRTR